MAKNIQELLEGHIVKLSPGCSLTDTVTGIAMDSRSRTTENLFMVIPGQHYTCTQILTEVSKQPGIDYYVIDTVEIPRIAPELLTGKKVITVTEMRRASISIIDRFYGRPQDTLRLIGITGTNGKTTTAFLLYQLLNALGIKTSCFGTVHYTIDAESSVDAPLTTPDALTLRKLFSQAAQRNVQTVVMEVSSHALDQDRIRGLQFDYGIFTNISQDHLDYHKNLAQYFDAKSKLFTKYLSTAGVSVINIDDSRGSVLYRMLTDRRYSYALDSEADVILKDIQYGKEKTAFSLVTKKETIPMECAYFGKHNMYNNLAALSVLQAMDIPLSAVAEAFRSLRLPPGRLERVDQNIYVDYAHTPDALEQSLHSLKQAGYGTIILVFGCGGDRDKKKRPLMGMIASQLANYTCITSDNPRSEDPESICAEIKQGCLGKNHCSIIMDRRQALQEALKKQKENPQAALLVAGKGHEEYQVLATGKIHFNDREEIKKLLSNS